MSRGGQIGVARLVLPKPSQTSLRQIAMAKVVRQRSRVVAMVDELVARRVPQYVRVPKELYRLYAASVRRLSLPGKWPFVFSGHGAPLSVPGFSRMAERAAVAADLGIKAHAHMLRYACGKIRQPAR